MFTQEKIDEFKEDIQIWYEDYVKNDYQGEWESQLKEIFQAAYGGNDVG